MYHALSLISRTAKQTNKQTDAINGKWTKDKEEKTQIREGDAEVGKHGEWFGR